MSTPPASPPNSSIKSASSSSLSSSDDTQHPIVKMPGWLGILLTLLMVIVVRETCLLICQYLGIATAANIVGLVIMLIILLLWRWQFGLPQWMTEASSRLLLDSGFAFLPVSAGAGLLLFALGDEFWRFMLVLVVSTLLPLWGLAVLANKWLNDGHTHNKKMTEQE